MKKNLIFRQLIDPETSTYTYLLADARTKEACIIDPVRDMAQRDLDLLQDLKLTLKYVLDTHLHADHITGSGTLRRETGAKIAICSAYELRCADIHLQDGDSIIFGEFKILALHTPGHTKGCMSFLIDDMLFTGDALLINGCGRTDFQEGSSEKLFHSIRQRLFSLPDETIVYPGHDYNGKFFSTVGKEKRINPRLNLSISLAEFQNIMGNLNLSYPKKMDEALPANYVCGLSV